MPKLNKMYYYTSTGEKKLNCYNIPIPKAIVEKVELEDKEIQIKVENKKIIIENKNLTKLK